MSLPRPALHYSPPSGWVNDPLGLTYHDGRYHLFFQYLPDRTTWDVACEWGHATSDDLLTWHTEPVALVPDADEGEDGVWSGSLVRLAGDDAVIFYTGVGAADREHGWVRRALAEDASWKAWRKEDVVQRPPDDAEVAAFRDPFVQRYGDGWRMLLAGGLTDGSGALWSSRSPDLVTWSAPVIAASGSEVGSLWECPSLLEVDGRSVLVVSTGAPHTPHSVAYAFCEDHGDRLDLAPFQRLTYGPSLYAASGFTEDSGEAGLIAWVRHVGDVEAGWMGVQSLPWRLSADGDRVVAVPHPVLQERRAGPADGVLPSVADIEWHARTGDVLVAADLFELEASAESVAATVGGVRHEMPWAGAPLRLVLDGPVLEMFGDRGVFAAPVPATGRDAVLSGSTERARVYRLG